jgi:flagellar hook-associated protein 3 FlgL
MSDRISSFAGPMTQDFLIQSMQSQLTTLTTEASSGLLANPAESMGANAASLYRLQADAAEQNTLQTTTTAAGDQLTAVQDALTSMATAVQSVATATINTASATPEGETAVAEQATSTMSQVLNLLNTQYAGNSLFAGDATSGLPMASADASGGPQDTINAVLNAAVAAKGGPLSSSDITNLIDGPNGLSSVFNNTNTNPGQNYNGAFYTGSTDGQPTTVLIGANQTLQYNASANQPAFTDLLKGLSMLSMLSAPSSQLDDSAKSALLQQAGTVIGQAQDELTSLQGNLGTVQSQLQQVSTTQQAAYSATTQQIATMEQADPATVATQLSTLQTQLEASYEVTAQISQLSLVHYVPTLTG